uniref:HicA toxin of toxin-antitoxin n=1 Tax=Candidatus Kentrum sp. FM TaxID=2126340 RepID=A0A450SGA1_9GAMM|nr:MAG: hypothetical protein BECKFM1743A_GA0114220_100977 [Candidatus Kentron sp. FM]VFJ52284.1 MAG: hypothetical protein BECKFM1743C_GA0114222_101077 [Candidatus Kentron sp. FM]VFK09262.1 MAG: hypothetical protein BECKFM1743B_GA0114221_101007 [Candidatus Kentron sp. FM]
MGSCAKRQYLIAVLQRSGCVRLRHGKKHGIYHNPESGASEPVPRHGEINEHLAKRIIRNLTAS